ncbi:HlyD family type I secretion periplasmic adaptor subunit [Candidatus Dactylopiibacterium carminicum]|uniref:HlyD family type I secretion periplasmic adaptor subunit n=1 Tax=Candidatus Dactylopiibacterium carminicum TaxID=857335 RepID=UPI001CC2BB76|nr:HlyD family type I secretion periplasmic adaptor subunit [Candidatus Dactylopiibacterium carminicum]
MDGPGFTRAQAEFLPAALSLQATPVFPAPRVAMWLLIAFAACALSWAIFGRMDIVATASGKIVPGSRTKTIQPFERSTIKAILVSDGQHVRAGDVLIEFDATITAAERDRLNRELVAARLQVLRAQGMLALLDTGRMPVLLRPEGTQEALWQETLRLLDGQYREYADKRARLESDVTQREAELRSTHELVRKLEQTAPIVQQRAEDYRNLADKNFISRHGYLEKEQARIELEADLATQRSRLTEILASLRTANASLAALASETRRIQFDSVNEGMQKADSLAQELRKPESRNQQNVLSAPVTGTVQQLAVHTIGGVVKEADPLMLVVPDEESVEIEAMLENKDVGFVREGQEAEVKIETFQYTKYGTLPARVVSVSNDAINDDKRGLIYATRLRLD